MQSKQQQSLSVTMHVQNLVSEISILKPLLTQLLIAYSTTLAVPTPHTESALLDEGCSSTTQDQMLLKQELSLQTDIQIIIPVLFQRPRTPRMPEQCYLRSGSEMLMRWNSMKLPAIQTVLTFSSLRNFQKSTAWCTRSRKLHVVVCSLYVYI